MHMPTNLPAPSISRTASPAARFRRLATVVCGAISRRKVLFVVGCLLSVASAAGLSEVLAKKLWESNGMLLYTPLTTAESTASMYVPPDLKTLVSIAEEPTALAVIADEFQLDIPIKALAASFEVTVASGTKTIEFRLKWGDAQIGADMVNQLMESFRSAVLDIRLRKIDDYAKGFEVNKQQASDRYHTSLKTLQDFNRTASSVDIGRELNLTNENMLQLQLEIGRVRRSELNSKSQAKELERYVTEMRRREHAEGEDKQFEAADETIADNRRRQDRLREMVTDERSRMEIEAQLVAKRAEQRRLLKLAHDNFASKEELERIGAEIGVLTAKVIDTEKIVGWKTELDRIDQVVVPKGKTKSQGSPVVQQALTKRLEIDLILLGNREELRELVGEIEEKRQRIDKLLSMQLKYQSLTKEVEAAELEVVTAAAGLREMRKLQSIRVPDLVVVTPATPSPYPTTNRKTLLVGFLVGGLLLATASVLLIDHLRSDGPTSTSVVSGLGLPMLERLTGDGKRPSFFASESVELRLLALRIRQAIRIPSAVCVFSTINEAAGSAWLIVPLAQCLARRDERVLIIDSAGLGDDPRYLESLIDARPLGEAQPGLGDYLVFVEDDLARVVLPTTIPAVDYLPRGTTPVGFDLLATYRMTELLDTLRDLYTMILIIGPRADRQVDLEILSARADGIIFLADDQSGRCLKSIPNIKILASLGAPILGAVVQTSQGGTPRSKRAVRKLDKVPA